MICLLDGPDLFQGICHELCGCGPDSPTCSAQAKCVALEPEFPVCMRPCDPLFLDSCEGVGHCALVGSGFFCMPDPVFPGVNGAECQFAQDCDPGFTCMTCGTGTCCRPFCNEVQNLCPVPLSCVGIEALGVDDECYPEAGVCLP